PPEQPRLIFRCDGVTFLAIPERRGVSRPGEAHDRQIGVPGDRGRLPPGGDAGVDRLPVVALAVEEKGRNADPRENRDRIEVQVRPEARLLGDGASHICQLEPRLACDRVDSTLCDIPLDLAARIVLVHPAQRRDLASREASAGTAETTSATWSSCRTSSPRRS